MCAMTKYCLCISSPSLAIAGEHRKRRTTRAHKQEAVSDWLNLHYLGTMSDKIQDTRYKKLYFTSVCVHKH